MRPANSPDRISPETLAHAKRYLAAEPQGDDSPADPSLAAGWQRFYDAVDPQVRRFVRTHARGSRDLDDYAQEVWLKLMRRLPAFEYDPARGAFSTWLYRMVRDTCISHFRHEHRHRRQAPIEAHLAVLESTEDPTRRLAQDDASRHARRMLQQIRRLVSQPCYDLVCMRWVQGRSVEETAEALGLTHKQVWYREHRARKKLRAAMAGHARPAA